MLKVIDTDGNELPETDQSPELAVERESSKLVLETHDFDSWNDIIAQLSNNNGVIVMTMEALRDIDGYGRLGANVRHNIARKLGSLGVGFLQKELPTEASSHVLLFRLGTPAAQVIEAVQTFDAGGANAVQHAADQLRNINLMPDPNLVRNGIIAALKALDSTVRGTELKDFQQR